VTNGRRLTACLAVVCLLALPGAAAAEAEQMVFGSFRSDDNARGWARQLEDQLQRDFHVERVHRDEGVWFRVRTDNLQGAERAALEAQAAAAGLQVWIIRGTYERPGTVTASTPNELLREPQKLASAPAMERATAAPRAPAAAREPPSGEQPAALQPASWSGYTDFDIGVQTRTYSQRGNDGQRRFQPSISGRLEFHRSWDDGRSSLTFTPFVRLDGNDDERTHVDVRELFWTRLGEDWELHLGARQIFWGVTEFNHLVDIINQTDLVENIDGEDKLGQPMVQLSLVRDWGIVDLFLLSGFRERTFPGSDGRLRGLPPVDSDRARYSSGAGRSRISGAVRWSHHFGPFSAGLYHFSGTSRDPRFSAEIAAGDLVLIPEYHVIEQTGFDGQLIAGDWAWKLEAIARSGDGGRYHAFTAGFERTLVGAFGSRGDLGLVAEFMYDERDEGAYNTLFEHDLALGGRWRANDMADTTALLGLIWDVETQEYLVSLEASRRLGANWNAVLEARVFGGAKPLDGSYLSPGLLAGEFKSRALQRDDYLQLELTRFF
jgi:hypothetical protein